jgi:hypothetical protein
MRRCAGKVGEAHFKGYRPLLCHPAIFAALLPILTTLGVCTFFSTLLLQLKKLEKGREIAGRDVPRRRQWWMFVERLAPREDEWR